MGQNAAFKKGIKLVLDELRKAGARGRLHLVRLMSTPEVPLRDQNDVLRAASFAAKFVESSFAELEPAIERAIGQMLEQQEPYPMTVMDGGRQYFAKQPGHNHDLQPLHRRTCSAAFAREPLSAIA
jgi:hypothetical protein